MDSPSVSYCIPAYNVEVYLSACVESIQGEGCEDFEIIIVDDSSIDETSVVANNLASKDSRITLIEHKENMGLPSARNTALAAVRGEFIRHVDADDLVVKGSTSAMLDVMNGADIARGSSLIFSESPSSCREMHWANNDISNEVVRSFFTSDFFKINALGYVWLYMYRTSFLEKEGFHTFPDGQSIMEDDIYNAHVLPRAESIAIVDDPVILYRDGGMSSENTWSYRQYLEQVSAFEEMCRLLADQPKFLSAYLNRKSIYLIERLKLFRKSRHSFEHFCYYAERFRAIYLNEDMSLYEAAGKDVGSIYMTHWDGNLKILRRLIAGEFLELYSELKG